VWAIVAAPGGLKMKPRTEDEKCPRGISSEDMKAAGAPQNSMSSFDGCTMTDLVQAFNRPFNVTELGRPVVDKSGLTGRYHMLVWQQYDAEQTDDGSRPRISNLEPFREAVEKELGLKLVEDRQNLHYINVVNVARPGAN
jgi:uncharacterized protein (TIGR03435 family)